MLGLSPTVMLLMKPHLTSRCREGHNNDISKYRNCNDAGHYARSNLVSEYILEEDSCHVQVRAEYVGLRNRAKLPLDK